jgi:hypothetical protein
MSKLTRQVTSPKTDNWLMLIVAIVGILFAARFHFGSHTYLLLIISVGLLSRAALFFWKTRKSRGSVGHSEP